MGISRQATLLAILLVIVDLVAIRPYIDTAVDDAYITWRYAKHLAEGYGLRWNTDDPTPTQGYTSTIWVLLNAVAIKTGIDPLLFSKLVLTLSLYGIAILAASMLGDNPFAQIAAVAAIVLFPATPTHLWSGMETVFFTLTVFALSWTALRALETGEKKYVYAVGILGTISYLTRPEGAIAATAALAMLYLYRRDAKTTAIAFLLVASTVAAHLIFNTYYFGDPLPLPAYRKWLVDNSTLNTLLSTLVEEGAVAVFVGFAALGSKSKEDTDRAALLFAVAIATFLPYFFIGRVMDFAARFAYASLLLSATAMFLALRSTIDRPSKAVAHLTLAFIIGLLTVQGEILMPSYGLGMRAYAKPTSSAILETAGSNGRVATGDIGAVGYLTDAHICDLLGLTNSELAKNGNDRNTVLEFLKRCDPDIIIVPSKCKKYVEPYYFPQRVAMEFAKDNNYTLCEEPIMFSGVYYHNFFVRNPEWCETVTAHAKGEVNANN